MFMLSFFVLVLKLTLFEACYNKRERKFGCNAVTLTTQRFKQFNEPNMRLDRLKDKQFRTRSVSCGEH